MLGRLSTLGLLFAAALAIALGCSSGDEDDMDACNRAWDRHCACRNVFCDGRPTSCTGPDKEWADCINAASDACTATCD